MNITTQIRKNLFSLLMISIFAVSCSKNSAQNSAAASNTNSTQSTTPVIGISPALKVYANAVTDVTGLLGLGGQLLNINLNSADQSFDISLNLPVQFISIAQSYLLKYPEIKTSTVVDANGKQVLHLNVSMTVALAAYKKWQQKNPSQPANPPIITKDNYAGTYSGTISPALPGVFGDGSCPQCDIHCAEVEAERGPGFCKGSSYGFTGTFNIAVAANGLITGELIVFGARLPIEVGQIPAGSNRAGIIVPGGRGEFVFGTDGSVSGYIADPNIDPEHMRGAFNGKRQ